MLNIVHKSTSSYNAFCTVLKAFCNCFSGTLSSPTVCVVWASKITAWQVEDIISLFKKISLSPKILSYMLLLSLFRKIYLLCA